MSKNRKLRHAPPVDSRISPAPPSVLAMVLCDGLWVDPMSGKCTLLGCFSQVQGASFPLMLHQMVVFTQITSLRGRVPLRLRIVDADEARPSIFDLGREVDGNDPLKVIELGWPVGQLIVPEPGEYRVQLWAGDCPLQERRIRVGMVGPMTGPAEAA